MSESFQLPLGLIQDGQVYRDIALVPMTAGMRRSLASKTSQKNPARGMTDMLCKCCESISGIAPSPTAINSLTTGDRDFILLMVRQMSLGDIITTQMICPSCSNEIIFDLKISDLEVKKCELNKDYELEGNFPVVSLESEELGLKVKLRMPTGFDQVAIADKVRVDPVLANYELFARLIKLWVENEVEATNPNVLAFIDNLPLKQLTWLEEEFRKTQPGPNWTTRVECGICGHRTLLDMGDSDFLFKTPR